jgi:signal transduction histidine kinase
VQIEGKEPPGKAAEMMYAAMQVCLNNALQYARATELEANVFENETGYTVMIYNNGQPPEREIREGGGLTNLRHRIETEGGRMLVQSFPEFALVIEIPKI